MTDAGERPTIERAYRLRLYPNRVQASMLSRLLGAKRFVWNWALGEQQTARRAGDNRPGLTELSRRFTALRQAPDTAWLSELPREPFNQVLRDLDNAWTNAFAGRARWPRFRRRGAVDAVRFTLDQRRKDLVTWAFRDDKPVRIGTVKLDRLGTVRMRMTERLVGRLRSVTVRRDAAGRWWACFTADGVPAPAIDPVDRPALGIDLGLSSTAALSDGRVFAAGKPLANKLARLRRYQRRYTRQRDAAARRQGLEPGKPFPKGTRIEPSRRMQRTRKQIGRLHAGIADARRDHQHQVSAAAVAGAQVICIESLDVKAMGRSMGRRVFRRGVADAGLGELTRQLIYKAGWYGRTVVKIDRWFPSSKTCSGCGHVNTGLKLQHRHWTCPACGQHHDRDLNAAVNIEREGLRQLAEDPEHTEPNTVPDGRTPRSGGTDARGEAVCADGKTSPPGQPTSVNREPDQPAAVPLTRDDGCQEQPTVRDG